MYTPESSPMAELISRALDVPLSMKRPPRGTALPPLYHVMTIGLEDPEAVHGSHAPCPAKKVKLGVLQPFVMKGGSVCMCVCVHVCVMLCVHVCVHVVCVHVVCVQVCVYTHMNKAAVMYTHLYTHAHTSHLTHVHTSHLTHVHTSTLPWTVTLYLIVPPPPPLAAHVYTPF